MAAAVFGIEGERAVGGRLRPVHRCVLQPTVLRRAVASFRLSFLGMPLPVTRSDISTGPDECFFQRSESRV